MSSKKNQQPVNCQCDKKYIDALKRMEPFIVSAYKSGGMGVDNVKKLAYEISKLGLTRDEYTNKYSGTK